MAWTLGKVAALLASEFGIEAGEYTQFLSRLRAFQRVGLFSQRNRGSGKAAYFPASDVIQFYVAMHLNLAGVKRETAALGAQDAVPIPGRTPDEDLVILANIPAALGSQSMRIPVPIPQGIVAALSAECEHG